MICFLLFPRSSISVFSVMIMNIAIGADHGGFQLKVVLVEQLKKLGMACSIWALTMKTQWITRIMPAPWRGRNP
jgi:hypothetical protein